LQHFYMHITTYVSQCIFHVKTEGHTPKAGAYRFYVARATYLCCTCNIEVTHE
jgi:hypothetical protein